MLSDLAFALAASGHTVQVITSRLTYEGDRMLPPNESVKNVHIVDCDEASMMMPNAK